MKKKITTATKSAAAFLGTGPGNNNNKKDSFSDLIQKTLGGQSYVAEDMPETTIFYDTGAYILNAAISGSMYGGVPGDLIYAFAGEEATGKTFYLFSIIDNFLNKHSDGMVILFETEGAPVKENLRARGIDLSRIVVSKVATIEEFRTKALNIAEAYKENKESRPLMMVLDSLGMLSTSKEVGDVSSGKEVRDMTRNQLIRGTFRVLSMKLNELKIPLYMSNHTYQVVGAYFPTKEMCLVKGSKIHTKNGLKNIETLKKGDLVETLDGLHEVVQTYKINPSDDLLEINFDDGTSVICSRSHKFLVNGEWMEAEEIYNIMEASDLSIEVASIKDGETSINVYRKQIQENLLRNNQQGQRN